MKRIIVLIVLMLAVTAWADPRFNHKQIQGNQTLTVATDSTGDSTYASGSANLVDNSLEGFKGMMAKIVLRGPISAYAGIGNQDSGWIWLRTYFAGDTFLLDSAVANSIPVTLRYELPAAAGTDTLLKDYLIVDWAIFDSLGDTTLAVKYDISWDINLK